MKKMAGLGSMLALGGVMTALTIVAMPDKLMTAWLLLLGAGYFGAPALGWYGHKLSGRYRVLVGLLAWVYLMTYTFMTIHVAQTYYHPGGH